jgi:hypothetical protein
VLLQCFDSRGVPYGHEHRLIWVREGTMHGLRSRQEYVHLALLCSSCQIQTTQVVRQRIHPPLAEAEHHRGQEQPARMAIRAIKASASVQVTAASQTSTCCSSAR